MNLKLWSVTAIDEEGRSTTIHAVAENDFQAYKEVLKSIKHVKSTTEDGESRKKAFEDQSSIIVKEIPFAIPHSLITENTF